MGGNSHFVSQFYCVKFGPKQKFNITENKGVAIIDE